MPEEGPGRLSRMLEDNIGKGILLLLTAVIAIGTWTLHETFDNAVLLASIETKLGLLSEDVHEGRHEETTQIGSIVNTASQQEAEISAVKQRLDDHIKATDEHFQQMQSAPKR